MTTLLRILLGLTGVVLTLGAIWYFGSSGSYAGFTAGSAMVAWAVLWNAKGSIQLINFILLIVSIISTCWIAALRFSSDPEAIAVALFCVLVAIVSAVVWIRQRFGY